MARLFHYTIREKLDRILVDKFIKQATDHISIRERPAVWFSYHPDWEETANSKLVDADGNLLFETKARTHTSSRGLVRIEIPASLAPHDWEGFKKLSGCHRSALDGMYNTAIECNSRPEDWRCSFDRVPMAQVIAIEYWNGESWQTEPFERQPKGIDDRIQGLLDMLPEIDEMIATTEAPPSGAILDDGVTREKRLAGARRLRVEILQDIDNLNKKRTQ